MCVCVCDEEKSERGEESIQGGGMIGGMSFQAESLIRQAWHTTRAPSG